jgi:hypothetical protein
MALFRSGLTLYWLNDAILYQSAKLAPEQFAPNDVSPGNANGAEKSR